MAKLRPLLPQGTQDVAASFARVRKKSEGGGTGRKIDAEG
jgi:hypothetical protein